MRKLIIATLIMTLIVAVLVGLMIYKAETDSRNMQAIASQLKARNSMLEITVIEINRQNKELKNTITGLNQEVEQLTLTNTADIMYIQTLEGDYMQALSYIGMAEWALGKQGIEFYYTGRR